MLTAVALNCFYQKIEGHHGNKIECVVFSSWHLNLQQHKSFLLGEMESLCTDFRPRCSAVDIESETPFCLD